MKNTALKLLDKLVKLAIIESANSTTSCTVYQPKAPCALKKFSKIDNDK